MEEGILSQAGLRTALYAELAADAEFLPRQPVDDAAVDDLAAAETWMQSQVKQLDVRPTRVVAVHKWRYGRRPVPALPLQYRVAYRSIVNDISERLWRERKTLIMKSLQKHLSKLDASL